MKEVYKGLYVGPEDDVPKARDKGMAIVHACKDGEHSHRSLLKYDTRSAPKGPEYLFARRGKELYLNLIDTPDPEFIPDKVINAGVDFITEQLSEGKSVFVHCVHGMSRSPSIALIWLAENGKIHSLSAFRRLYPDYAPSDGIKYYTKRRLTSRR